MNPAAMTERLIDAAVYNEEAQGGYVAGARKEVNEARAAIEDALSSQSLSLSEAREEIERLKGERDAFLAELGDVEVAGWSSAAFKLKRVLEACEENEKAAEKERDEAVAELCRWRAAFQRVTPGGSEFFDPKAVREWADALKMQVFEANKRAVLAERKVLENGPAGLADATNDPADPDLSSLRKGAEVAVKPLEWRKSNMPSWDGDYHTVPTAYTVRLADENGWKWQGLGAHGYASSPEAAQRDAQRHHETRIRSALVSGSREDGE